MINTTYIMHNYQCEGPDSKFFSIFSNDLEKQKVLSCWWRKTNQLHLISAADPDPAVHPSVNHESDDFQAYREAG